MKKEVKEAIERVGKMDYSHLRLLGMVNPTDLINDKDIDNLFSYVLSQLIESYFSEGAFFMEQSEHHNIDDSLYICDYKVEKEIYQAYNSVVNEFECLSVRNFTENEHEYSSKRTSNYVKEVAEKFRPYYI